MAGIHRFDSGERHAVYRVTTVAGGERQAMVVRIALGNSPKMRAEADQEARVLACLAGVGAPRLRNFRLDDRRFAAPCMCMDYIDGDEVDLTAAAPVQLSELGRVMARVHSLPYDNLFEIPQDETLAACALIYAEGIAVRLSALVDEFPSPARSLVLRGLRFLDERSAEAQQLPEFQHHGFNLLHGDAIASNIIWAPSPVLIDWEYARLGDPADEIGYIFGQHRLSADQRRWFWDGYVSAAMDPELRRVLARRVAWWEPVVMIGSATWWLERSPRANARRRSRRREPCSPQTGSYYLGHTIDRLRTPSGDAPIPRPRRALATATRRWLRCLLRPEAGREYPQ